MKNLSQRLFKITHTHTHTRIYIYIYIYIYHHIPLVARIFLTLSRSSSLSFIALGRSSGQHPVSSHSCWMYVRAGRPAFARPCVGVHKSTSLMSSSLLLQQCPACLARLTWIVFVIGGRWPYSWCLVGCCRQDLLYIYIYIYIYIYSNSSQNLISLFRMMRNYVYPTESAAYSSGFVEYTKCIFVKG